MAKAETQPKSGKDPYDIHSRLQKLISDVFDEYENDPKLFSIKDKLAVIQYVGMWMTRDLKIQDATDESNAGSAVAKYSGAFRVKNATGSRKAPARPALVHSSADDDDDGDDAA